MGNKWISVYTDELDQLQAVVRSQNQQMAEQAVQRYKQKAGAHAKQSTIEAIRTIVDGGFESGMQCDPTLIYAFEHICRSYSRKAETIEIEVNADIFPEMFDFVSKSKSDPFGLPKSEKGSPSWAHWTNPQVKRFLSVFGTIDSEKLRSRMDSDYEAEIEALCNVLRTALEEGQGVFVFCNE